MLDRHTLDILAIAGCGAGGVGILVGLSAQARVSRLRRRVGTTRGRTAATASPDEVHRLREELDGLRDDIATARSNLTTSLRHVAVVRYDAFQDMGGRLSFSAALLDDEGDGLVITAISGRSESRTYAKGVKAGRSEHTLSPEEEQAIEAALRGGRALSATRS